MVRQRPWFAAVVAFVTVLGIGGIAFGAQTVFSTDTEPAADDAPVVAEEPADPGPATTTAAAPPTTGAPPPAEAGGDTRGEPADLAKDDDPTAGIEDDADDSAPEPKDTVAPELVILEPADGAELTEKVITFSGETEPGATVMAGKYAAEVDDAGRWSIVLVLSPGANKASFAAHDAAGNTSEASIVLTYVVPPDEDTKDEDTKDEDTKDDDTKDDDTKVEETKDDDDTKKDDGDGDAAAVDFTANQVYGSCDSIPPYDVFWGTAAPGAKVKVWSEYGSAKVYAGESGEWEVKVPFTAPPFGEPFTVTVSSGEMLREFSFTSYVDPGPVEYTITQLKAESDSPEPYAKFAGTADAGTVIEATSAYGAASLVVEHPGEWWLKVFFTGQPPNETFPVVVSAAGQSQEFGFTWYQGEG